MEKGDWFIQNGANSGVGRAAIQFGRLWGLKSINIIRVRPEMDKLKDELKELGADVVVTEEELADKGFRKTVKELTGDKGVKLGLNCVGGKATTDLIRQLGYIPQPLSKCGIIIDPTLPQSQWATCNIRCHVPTTHHHPLRPLHLQ